MKSVFKEGSAVLGSVGLEFGGDDPLKVINLQGNLKATGAGVNPQREQTEAFC